MLQIFLISSQMSKSHIKKKNAHINEIEKYDEINAIYQNEAFA
jgi:hypothetical protein